VRAVLLAIALVVATGLVACGGDGDKGETADSLTLEQRLSRESEIPGSKEDPVEVRLTADNLDEFTGWRGQYVAAAEIDRSKLEKAGFVSAIHDTRFIPKTPGGPHTRDAPHVRMLAIQFESDDGAVTGADLVYKNSLKPCPGQCAMEIKEFDVSGVPDAKGVRHFITAESLETTGDEGEPFDSYAISFADGPFAYELEGFGPPGKISEKQIEEIAQKVRDRVEGAPPAGTQATGY
jgi:hypothetical protein